MNFKNLIASALLVTAGCAENASTNLGPNGLPYQRAYIISQTDIGHIQFSMLDGVNSLRRARGLAVQANKQDHGRRLHLAATAERARLSARHI